MKHLASLGSLTSFGVAIGLATAGCDAPSSAPSNATGVENAIGVERITEEGIRAHVRFLSHDLLEGRAPGTRGGELAAQYIATQFEGMGLEQVERSYLQPVPLVGHTPQQARLAFSGPGGTLTPGYLDDFVVWSGDPTSAETSVRGELVFVGYGISAPEWDWDDFGDEELEGKVLLILVNDPPPTDAEPQLFEGDAMTYYGRWTYKYEEAARRGAAGALIIHTTAEAGYPWSVVRGSWSGEQYALPPVEGAQVPVGVPGWLSEETAESVVRLGGLELGTLVEAAASRDFRPVHTGVELEGAVSSVIQRVETANVVGLLPGSERPDEVIVLMAHYDHLGVGDPVDGDPIYNGAYDNASGVAALLELAAAFASLDTAPERSLLFMATAAEESGLLGAHWYVSNPLFPLHRTVVAVNVDGVNLWGETDDMVVLGADRSEVGPFVERRASEMGVHLAPDPLPGAGYFFRSDHFPFALAGVPALWIRRGEEFRGRPEGWGRELTERYNAEIYHSPRDRFSDDFVFDGAVQQATLFYLTVRDLAADQGFPNWLEGSEFRAARDRMMGDGR